MSESNYLTELIDAVTSGKITTKQLIQHGENSVKNRQMPPDMLSFIVKFCGILDRIMNSENGAEVSMQELFDLGLYDSIDDMKNVIKKSDGFQKISYPEPTESEINENIDFNNQLCIICCHRNKNTVFVPCGHSVLCTVCSKKTAIDNTDSIKCLTCRKNIDKIQRIYL